MHPETTARLALECKNIVGFKAASGNLEQIKRLLEIKPDTLDVLSGDDALTYEIMKAGGVGVISVFGNVYPKEFVAFVRLMQQGRYNDAKVLNESYSEVYKLLFADGNPAGAKAQLSNMGYIKNVLRLPLVPANEEVREALREAGEKLQAGSILY
jgi:4-hydroxy-tetrahydrodipicolinate synthase